MDYFHRFFKLAPKEESSKQQTDYLTAYDALNRNGMRLEEMPEKCWVGKDGKIIREAEVIEK